MLQCELIHFEGRGGVNLEASCGSVLCIFPVCVCVCVCVCARASECSASQYLSALPRP